MLLLRALGSTVPISMGVLCAVPLCLSRSLTTLDVEQVVHGAVPAHLILYKCQAN
jgi:hypothetical protein